MIMVSTCLIAIIPKMKLKGSWFPSREKGTKTIRASIISEVRTLIAMGGKIH
jgi:hypothetical protein